MGSIYARGKWRVLASLSGFASRVATWSYVYEPSYLTLGYCFLMFQE